ncbi:ATP-binding protein [Streptomyces sp. NPDC012888]|uniref:ATP-binding protein n=1 Tax=Streptomyces sp. NPDC012888 TaxID=3364855 RepID=UPI0036BFA13B
MNEQLSRIPVPVHTFTVQLSSTPRGARLARLLAVEQLRGWGLFFGATAHVVAELANNAITHGLVPGRDFRLGLVVDGRGIVRVEVADTRADRVPVVPGRGLAIVGALAEGWGVEPGPAPRKTVWALVDAGSG